MLVTGEIREGRVYGEGGSATARNAVRQTSGCTMMGGGGIGPMGGGGLQKGGGGYRTQVCSRCPVSSSFVLRKGSAADRKAAFSQATPLRFPRRTWQEVLY